ncbi:MAG: PfkB family carbohydrate kinase [Firmicutes bacterium]|nr:PfkB family carbohydrate kinase [Bacillota bacterium]
MKLKPNAQHNLAILTSMGLRMTPANRQPAYAENLFKLQGTSAESNVATISATLGKNVLALTKFVQGSPMAEFIKRDLRARNIQFVGREVPQGGPWGYRHQFNIADAGYGARGPVVCNDRAGEVGATIAAEDFDLAQIFDADGVQILHLSGLIAALSESTGKACLAVAEYAKKSGTLISFDLNYRASFWKGREKELAKLFSSVASLSDILIGNEEDFQLCLGVKGPEAGGKGIETAHFIKLIEATQKAYPNVSVFATTLREVISANTHLWGAIGCMNGVWTQVPLREITVLDRIGGGDGFVGGLLYGILQGWDIEKATQFAWASGALATTFETDYAHVLSEQQVFSIYNADARVKR